MIKTRPVYIGLALALLAATSASIIKAVQLSAREAAYFRGSLPESGADDEDECRTCPCETTARAAYQPAGALVSPYEASAVPEVKRDSLATFVLLVSVDGLRADAVYPRTSILGRIATEGSRARNAWTIPESVTLPAHASMISGVGVKKHGVGFNFFRLGWTRPGFPTIFDAVHAAGLSTAMFIGKQKLQLLDEVGSVDRIEYGKSPCFHITKLAVPYIRTAPPGVAFVHLPDLDSAGHRYGWLSPKYLAAMYRIEGCVRQLVEAVERRGDLSRFLLIVTSDHGGHDTVHGTLSREDRHIPWIVWGGAAVHGAELQRPVSITDTAATILYALGLDQTPEIEGKPVFELLAPQGAINESAPFYAEK